jgi:NADH-quinone oxidoreductase subunit J
MDIAFYVAAVIAIVASLMAVTHADAVHALLYLIVSLLAVAVIFFLLGAPFAAALEVVIYAGAIVVLFVFVVMMLNLGEEAVAQEIRWLEPEIWVWPSALSGILLIEVLAILWGLPEGVGKTAVSAEQVGAALFGPYVLAVELASMLLLAALVGAYHIGRRG